MRHFIVSCFIVLLALPVLAADSVYQTTLLEAGQSTSEVTTAELQQILIDKSAVVFDARPVEEFSMSHIPGALNVAQKPGEPLSLYTSDVAEIDRLLHNDRSTAIVLYCNGPFCGKSKRLAADLLAAGYTNIRRYQLGMPVWRALVGINQIELSAVQLVYAADDTAEFVDARPQKTGATVRGAVHIPLAEVTAAKDDGRLPMLDHNTRIIVFGESGAQARAVAASLAKNAFDNVTFFDGTVDQLRRELHAANRVCGGAVFDREP